MPSVENEIENTHVTAVVDLRSPQQLKAKLPLSSKAAETVLRARRELRDILAGRDRERLAVVIGPCSIHDPEAALEYAGKLREVAARHEDRLLIVMRTYFEKARTNIGWKGLVNDPDLDGSCDIDRGLELARRILVEINETGLSCGTEFLDPVIPQYLGDAVAWAAIGARTTESQTHREMASGLSMPVGFKNGTDCNLDVALHAMISAGHPHAFLGIDANGVAAVGGRAEIPTGTSCCAAGAGAPTTAPTTYARPPISSRARGSRGRSWSTARTATPRRTTAASRSSRATWRPTFRGGESRVMGLLIESNLAEGRQDWAAGELRHGVSITDACIGWEETTALLEELAGGRSKLTADGEPTSRRHRAA